MQRQAVKTKPLTRDEALRLLRAHEAEIRAQGVTRLAVFGSTARDEARADSDLDLLVDIDWRRKSSLFDWAGLELRLRDLLGREVEVTLRCNLKPCLSMMTSLVERLPLVVRAQPLHDPLHYRVGMALLRPPSTIRREGMLLADTSS